MYEVIVKLMEQQKKLVLQWCFIPRPCFKMLSANDTM